MNGDLEKEVYIGIPPGIESPATINNVCKLRKSLYGLKQCPCALSDMFSKVLKKFGYN